MYAIVPTSRYKRSFKRIARHKDFDLNELERIIDLLANAKELTRKNRDHELTGTLRGFRECHIASDILLVYKIEHSELVLVLVDIGTHASLFG